MPRGLGGGAARRSWWRLALLASVAASLTACSRSSPSALRPAGPDASRDSQLFWLMLGIAGGVFVLVAGLTIVGLVRSPRAPDGPDDRDRLSPLERRFVVGGGVLLPVVVLGLLGVLTVRALADMQQSGAMEVRVVGHQYWWEVRYPQGAVTANEVHIPTHAKVRLVLTSADVIHSFWVPQLAGKTDLVPGRTNTMEIEARAPGVYRGQCAEYCGIQHANMAFSVVAQPRSEFDRWVADEARPARQPATDFERRGREVIETASCAGCHTVRGTRARGLLGPDLTHLASRRTLGAGTVPNDVGNLAGWVLDAQSIKPGSQMPAVEIEPAQLQALLAYLESLR